MATLEQQLADAIKAQNDLTQAVALYKSQLDLAVAAQISALNTWRDGARAEFALPYTCTVTVGGDANTYYPVPIANCIHNRLGRLVVARRYDDPHPSSLGTNHVGGLLLELSIRGDLWMDFNLTRIDFLGFAYHNTVARVVKEFIGRLIWLRGGGMQYQFSSDFPLSPGSNEWGTLNLKPILLANTPIYPNHPSAPYAGGGGKVSPLTAVDALLQSAITTPTSI